MKIILPPITKGDWQDTGLFTLFNHGPIVEQLANGKAALAVPALLQSLYRALDILTEIYGSGEFPGILNNDLVDLLGECETALTLAGCVIEP